jgi:hypothetical protein
MVALIVGGTGNGNIEAYSPDGRCSLTLGNIPLSPYLPIIGFINGKLTYCSTFNYDNRFNEFYSEFFSTKS